MKTTVFYLNHPIKIPDQMSDTQSAEYCVPILPSYAIEYSILKTPPGYGMDLDGDPTSEEYEGDGFEIRNDVVVWKKYRRGIHQEIVPILYIYYHGIRDYTLLFPSVKERGLRVRLGKFYEEAEKTFDSGAWLSFSLMCGAVFEGLLESRVSERDFDGLIDAAKKENLLSSGEADMMHVVRKQRNLVHASRHGEAYVSRKMAMDIRKTLDIVVKKFSYFGLG